MVDPVGRPSVPLFLVEVAVKSSSPLPGLRLFFGMAGTSCWTVEGWPFGGLGDLVVPNWVEHRGVEKRFLGGCCCVLGSHSHCGSCGGLRVGGFVWGLGFFWCFLVGSQGIHTGHERLESLGSSSCS